MQQSSRKRLTAINRWIEVKRYGEKVAVNDLSFDVEPGHVTGFLGPNGAGKTTSMRLILGLDYPNAGTVRIDGKQYARLANPMREVGR